MHTHLVQMIFSANIRQGRQNLCIHKAKRYYCIRKKVYQNLDLNS